MEQSRLRIAGELFTTISMMAVIWFAGIALLLWHATQSQLGAYQSYYVQLTAYGMAAAVGIGYLLVAAIYGLLLINRLIDLVAEKLVSALNL